jgi:hypothetical protein
VQPEETLEPRIGIEMQAVTAKPVLLPAQRDVEYMGIFEEYPHLLEEKTLLAYDFGGCYTANNADGGIHELDVAAGLLVFEGNVSKVAHALKRSRRVIDTFISRSISLSDLREDIYEAFVDETEDLARRTTRQGDAGMLRFMLQTIGKSRGYVSRVEATGRNGKDLNVVFYLPDNAREAGEIGHESRQLGASPISPEFQESES